MSNKNKKFNSLCWTNIDIASRYTLNKQMHITSTLHTEEEEEPCSQIHSLAFVHGKNGRSNRMKKKFHFVWKSFTKEQEKRYNTQHEQCKKALRSKLRTLCVHRRKVNWNESKTWICSVQHRTAQHSTAHRIVMTVVSSKN